MIHNTFPLPARTPNPARLDPRRLRLYWFSQTIGPGRGLEDAIRALDGTDFGGRTIKVNEAQDRQRSAGRY